MNEKSLVEKTLACPVDKGALVFQENSVQCVTCKQNYAVDDGIYCLMPLPSPDAAHAFHEQKARDKEADIYDKNLGLKFLTGFEIKRYAASLADEIKNETPLLEIACGTGRFTPLLAPRFLHTFSLDVSIESLRVLRKKLAGTPHEKKVTLIHADAAHLPFASETFEKVGCFQMFQHLPSHDIRCKMLAEIQRVLKNGGKLSLSAYRDHPFLTFLWKKEGTHPNGSYFYRFAKHELEYVLDGYFNGVNVTPMPFFYVWLATCKK